MFMDGAAIVTIVAPILYPAAVQYGVNPLQFGIIMILNVSLGSLTPPFGACMYQACNLCDVEMPEFLWECKELMLTTFIVLLMATFIPGISTLIPTFF